MNWHISKPRDMRKPAAAAVLFLVAAMLTSSTALASSRPARATFAAAGSGVATCGFFGCTPSSDPQTPLVVGVPMKPGSNRSLNVKVFNGSPTGIAPGTTVLCSLDGAPEVDCTNGLTRRGLSVGIHTLEAVSLKAVGSVRSETNRLTWQITSPVAAPSASGASPTVEFAGTYPANYWDITLDGAFNTNDPKGKRRNASRIVGVQLSSATDQPSETEAAPASGDPRVVGYRATHVKWVGYKPKWVRVQNAAGAWSGWAAFQV